MVLARVSLVVERKAHFVAADTVPELSAVINVDGVSVIFPAANGHYLLTCREEEVVGKVPVEVSPVGTLEKGVGKANIGRVEALAKVVGEPATDVAVQGHHQIFARKAVGKTWSHRIISEVVVDSKVGAGAQLKVVESNQGLFVLRKSLRD